MASIVPADVGNDNLKVENTNIITVSVEFRDQLMYQQENEGATVSKIPRNDPTLFIPIVDVIDLLFEAEHVLWSKIVNSPFPLNQCFDNHSLLSDHSIAMPNTSIDSIDETNNKELNPLIGEAFLRHGKSVQEIHGFFVKLDPRRCCVSCRKVDDNRKGPGLLKRVQSLVPQEASKKNSVKKPVPRQRSKTRTVNLNEKEVKIYKRILQCAIHPVLSCPINEPSPSPLMNKRARPDSSLKRRSMSSVDFVSIEQNMLFIKIQRSFQIHLQLHNKILSEIRRNVVNHDDTKALSFDLMEQLTRLENNECIFYHRESFASPEFYEDWRKKELEYVKTLIHKWCQHTSVNHIRAYSLDLFDAHAEFKVITQKFIKYDLNEKIDTTRNGPKNQNITSLLTTASRKLLKEYGLRYGVGETYRKIMELECMVDNLDHTDWYLACLNIVLDDVMRHVKENDCFIVKKERQLVQDTLEALHHKIEYCFVKIFSLYQKHLTEDGVKYLLLLLQRIIDGKILFDIWNPEENQSVASLLKQYIKLGVIENYKVNRQLADLAYFEHLPTYDSTLSAEVLRHVLQDMKKCLALFQNLCKECPQLLQMNDDLVKIVAKTLYELFMLDIKELCYLNTATIETYNVDYEMIGLAFRLDKLDNDWNKYISTDEQKWRNYYGIVLTVAITAITEHVLQNVPNYILNDDLHVIDLQKTLPDCFSVGRQAAIIQPSLLKPNNIGRSGNSAFATVKSIRETVRKGSTITIEGSIKDLLGSKLRLNTCDDSDNDSHDDSYDDDDSDSSVLSNYIQRISLTPTLSQDDDNKTLTSAPNSDMKSSSNNDNESLDMLRCNNVHESILAFEKGSENDTVFENSDILDDHDNLNDTFESNEVIETIAKQLVDNIMDKIVTVMQGEVTNNEEFHSESVTASNDLNNRMLNKLVKEISNINNQSIDNRKKDKKTNELMCNKENDEECGYDARNQFGYDDLGNEKKSKYIPRNNIDGTDLADSKENVSVCYIKENGYVTSDNKTESDCFVKLQDDLDKSLVHEVKENNQDSVEGGKNNSTQSDEVISDNINEEELRNSEFHQANQSDNDLLLEVTFNNKTLPSTKCRAVSQPLSSHINSLLKDQSLALNEHRNKSLEASRLYTTYGPYTDDNYKNMSTTNSFQSIDNVSQSSYVSSRNTFESTYNQQSWLEEHNKNNIQTSPIGKAKVTRNSSLSTGHLECKNNENIKRCPGSTSQVSFESLLTTQSSKLHLPQNGLIMTTRSISDLLVLSARLISFSKTVCSLVLPCAGKQYQCKDLQEQYNNARISILKKVLSSLDEVIRSYASNILSLDMCGSKLGSKKKSQTTSSSSSLATTTNGRRTGEIDENFLTEVKNNQSTELPGCRHCLTVHYSGHGTKHDELFDNSCVLLERLLHGSLGNWELITKEMCLRINNIYSMIKVLPFLQQKVADSLQVELERLLPEIDSENESVLNYISLSPSESSVTYPRRQKLCFKLISCEKFLCKILHLQVKFITTKVMDVFNKLFDALLSIPLKHRFICQHMKTCMEFLQTQTKFFQHCLYKQCVQFVTIEIWKAIIEKYHELLDQIHTIKEDPRQKARTLLDLLMHTMSKMNAGSDMYSQFHNEMSTVLFRLQVFSLPLNKLTNIFAATVSRDLYNIENGKLNTSFEEVTHMLKQPLREKGKLSFTGSEFTNVLLMHEIWLSFLTAKLRYNLAIKPELQVKLIGRYFLKKGIIKSLCKPLRFQYGRPAPGIVLSPVQVPAYSYGPHVYMKGSGLTIPLLSDEENDATKRPSVTQLCRERVPSDEKYHTWNTLDSNNSLSSNDSVDSNDVYPKHMDGEEEFHQLDDAFYTFTTDPNGSPTDLALTGKLFSLIRQRGDWIKAAVQADIKSVFTYVYIKSRTKQSYSFFERFGLERPKIRRFSCLW